MDQSMRWSIDRVHGVVHGPRSMFCTRPQNKWLSGNKKTDDTLTRVLFTTNDTRHIIDHGAMTRFPAYSHTNSAIFAGIFEPDENDFTATVCPRHRDLFGTRWRRAKGSHGRVLCSIPTDLAVHTSPNRWRMRPHLRVVEVRKEDTQDITVSRIRYVPARRKPLFSVNLKTIRG